MTSPLQAIFAPRRVAVIGAGQDPLQVRGRLVHNLKVSGFKGDILPIHPKHAEIQGLRAYPSVSEAGPGIDLAMIAVPSESLLDVLRECGQAKVKGAVVISGIPGGPAGHQLQAEVTRVAREQNVRVLGPNCLGFFRPFGNVAATFSPLDPKQFASTSPDGKRVSIISQSGGTGLQIYEMCAAAGMNVVQVIMPGNEADIELVELLDHAVESGEVDLVLMYIEGINDGPGFVRAADKAAAAGIPIIAMKVGKSQAASRAAISHTAHLTGSDAVYEAVFDKYGITRVYDPDSMVSLASVMARRVPMRGRRVGIVSAGGGHATIWTDLCEINGLSVPSLSQALYDEIATYVPPHGSANNPVDTAGSNDDRGLKIVRAMKSLLRSDEVDAVVATCHFGLTGLDKVMWPYLKKFDEERKKPVVLVSAATPSEENVEALNGMGYHLLTLAEATQALKALARFNEIAAQRAASAASPARSRAKPPANLRPDTRAGQNALLKHYGIRLPAEALATSEDAAAAAARDIGFPVVLKIESQDIPHKTEAGGVRLNVADEAGVRLAFHEIQRDAKAFAPQARIDGVLVQAMAKRGREMIVGTIADDTFGPQIMVGFGGTYAEILKDTVLAPLPLDKATAASMIQRLRGVEILQGARGEKPDDIDSLAELLVGVSQLVADHPDVQQLDLNPVIVYAQGEGHCVVDTLFVNGAAS
ncbi:acetate--CoA ligase family protein [Ramlibacter sp.]|uniref:acetate--CoA ligase family protein n=1 Tax=Ramlibacter sp. TaxID=1917967 RepID=UPI003D0EF0B5